MATGSKARTRAPRRLSPAMISSDGAARRSSVSGLNESPSTATTAPRAGRPRPRTIFSTMSRIWLRFAAMVASTMPVATPAARPIADSASVSLGKHEPP